MNRRGGFTLVEIILAMSLAIVIMVILFSALRLGYRAQERGGARAEATQKLRIINDRISWLIRGIYPYVINQPDMRKIAFEGASDRIGFVTTSVDSYATGPEDRAGLKWVSISADNKGLRIREKVFFLPELVEESGGRDYVLDPGVKKLEFSYFDLKPEKTEKEKEGEWVAEWDTADKQYLPAAVKVKITLEQNGRNEPMPEMIVRLNVLTKLQ